MRRIFIVIILWMFLIPIGCTGNKPKTPNTTPNITPNTSTSQQKVFTVEELKKYDGKNGNSAYVAVNGIVYDVTNSRLWKNGLHNDCSNSTYAGADFSQLINSSPHGAGIMNKMPVVGTLKK